MLGSGGGTGGENNNIIYNYPIPLQQIFGYNTTQIIPPHQSINITSSSSNNNIGSQQQQQQTPLRLHQLVTNYAVNAVRCFFKAIQLAEGFFCFKLSLFPYYSLYL
jgi:hypothetical protein